MTATAMTATNDNGPKKVHDGHTEDYDGQTMTATNTHSFTSRPSSMTVGDCR